MSSAVLMANQSACDHEMDCPPCEHNQWSDLRTRKRMKMLLCTVCLTKWRLCVCRCSRDGCITWTRRGNCSMGLSCPKLHIGHARPRAQPGNSPVSTADVRCQACVRTSAAPLLDALPTAPFSATPGTPGEAPLSRPSDCDPPDAMSPPQLGPAPYTPTSGPCSPPGAIPCESPSHGPSSAAVSLRSVEPWPPPMCVSACGEFFEELDGYEPEGVAMTEEQLDAFLRRCCLA
eukprot:TRINITY_DN2854_c0_g1_i1.p1 TRINITY_DN2854_c0_g1~~TRINITY_DN2854_c0_g1_i1.p1  ORF type:complete len:258 (+),score=47.34 TRINITY_DN2854_c0_g1_i1:80-775(+)